MQPDHSEAVLLEAPVQRGKTYIFPWLGLLVGMGVGILTGHPIAMVVYNFHDYIYNGTPLNLIGAIRHSFEFHMWPMISLYAVLGGIFGGIFGRIFQHLRENRLRLDSLQQEFELQVATLRHHYKNLALGIQGFSQRSARKLGSLEEHSHRCLREDCPEYRKFLDDFEALKRNVHILEDASQRLGHTLSQELLFLKALTSDRLSPLPRDFYPVLRHCIEDLREFRFHSKEIRVEVNGKPLEDCRDSLVFSFEPYTMEVILQNILANAMNFGDFLKITVNPMGNRVHVEIQDNGPGLDISKLKENLLIPGDRREAESTHLGLRVTLHLMEKCGGRLYVSSSPVSGALFILDFPKG
jgi:signal transduction histidine kinase